VSSFGFGAEHTRMEHSNHPSDATTFTMQGTETAGYVDGIYPEALQALSFGALGSPDVVRDEIDAMLAAVRSFWQRQPDQVMRDCAAYSARCTELEVHLLRIEGVDRHYKQIRTLQVKPLLEELDRQFRIASRLIEIRRQDIDLTRG
jgi:hypothetical protein